MVLRVVHVLRAPKGGAFRHVCDLVRGQAERGHQVGLVCSTEADEAATDMVFAELTDVCALGIHRIPMKRLPGWSDVRAVRSLGEVCREVGADVMHGHGAKGAAYVRLLASAAGAKAVYTPHGGSLHYSWRSAAGAVFLGLERLLETRTDGILFESEYARRTYERKIGAVKCLHRVVYNGLHEDEFTPVGSGSRQYDFVFVGEIRRLKGIFVLLDAMVRLRGEGRTPSLLIVGSGPDDATLRSRIDELDLGDAVTLSPPIHPARDAFALARCVVTPSFAESLPYIVLEAVAAGVPLLATRVGGIPEIFGPLADFLLPPGDAGALAGAMGEAMSNPGAAMDRADRVHAHVKQHLRVAQMVNAVVDFYEEVLGSPRSGNG
ncbi:MAG: glycosyltransferase family 4 protein [Gemmatimonadota bacterium]|nr:glycosyltransferase family 4 protein [Gemmatimonadota bacterium]MDH3423021.1 glycosyltransferase family 4 protein [Gemmatimonadota bacterium]